ncbi:hypothetical protein VNO77_08180 [Canavalia gladiata]|uniref:Uncharacterized protein n=1 Tax=Canavalia gladiata TaxID=3824 RepID=A0AAN9M896_CANGL
MGAPSLPYWQSFSCYRSWISNISKKLFNGGITICMIQIIEPNDVNAVFLTDCLHKSLLFAQGSLAFYLDSWFPPFEELRFKIRESSLRLHTVFAPDSEVRAFLLSPSVPSSSDGYPCCNYSAPRKK